MHPGTIEGLGKAGIRGANIDMLQASVSLYQFNLHCVQRKLPVVIKNLH